MTRPGSGALFYQGGLGPSSQQQLGHHLVGGSVSEPCPGAAVELCGDEVEVGTGVPGQVGALGEVLAQESVDVLVPGPLPRRAGIGEVDFDVGLLRDVEMVRELLATVPGQGLA
jgi:hypothetical protein